MKTAKLIFSIKKKNAQQNLEKMGYNFDKIECRILWYSLNVALIEAMGVESYGMV